MIPIVEKFRPFSHSPGISCLIPGTGFEAEVYPALVRIFDIQTGERALLWEEEIPIQGPLKDFTVVQDLEKGVVSVFGKDLYYHILPNLTLSFQKKMPTQKMPVAEKLFLGMHKQQNWDFIFRRGDFREIFPLWVKISSLLPKLPPLMSSGGVFSLLKNCENIIKEHSPEKILSCFHKLFLVGFRNMFVPSLRDEKHQGILFPSVEDKALKENPLYLLSLGGQLIRSLFIEVRDSEVYILPNVPPEFFSGRFINLDIAPYGVLSLEWTKKMIRRVTLQSTYEGYIPLHFHSSLKCCRVRRHEKERGYPHFFRNKLEIKSKGVYLLDRFEK